MYSLVGHFLMWIRYFHIFEEHIVRAAAKVTPFSKTSSRLWFSQLESQLFTAGITLNITKYHTLFGSMESRVFNAISHFVENPLNQNLYEALKKILLSQF